MNQPRFVLTFLLCLVLTLPPAAWAANVVIPNPDFSGSNAYGNSVDNSGNDHKAAPENNQLEISNNAVTGNAYGAWSEESRSSGAPLRDNWVTINPGALVGGSVYGSWNKSSYASVESSRVVINDNGQVGGSVYGGYSEASRGAFALRDADAWTRNNRVIISGNGWNVGGSVYGGYSSASSSGFGGPFAWAQENRVDISDSGTIGGDVYGGYSTAINPKWEGSWVSANSYANQNKLNISGNVSAQNAYGGYSKAESDSIYPGVGARATANENQVTISNNFSLLNVYGGFSDASCAVATTADANVNASLNSVTINGNGWNVQENVYGGSGNGYSNGFGGANVWAESNSVNISGNGTIGGDVNGGFSLAVNLLTNMVSSFSYANQNMVKISGGTINGNVHGGYSQAVNSSMMLSAAAEANKNTVIIEGNALVGGSVYGGWANRHNSSSKVDSSWATANHNQVTISDGRVNGSVYGGWAQSMGELSNDNAKVTASNNQVTISGGQVDGNIYGGWVQTDPNRGSAAISQAVNNTVTLSNSGNLGKVYGGFTTINTSISDAFTGNTLNKNSAVNVGGAYNFEFVNFGYTGNANINTLDITPTGSARAGVILNTQSNDINFNGLIVGSGSLTKQGTGILTLSQANIYSGGTTVKQGLINFANPGNLGTGGITLDGGGLQWAAGNSSDISGRLEPLGSFGGIFDTGGNNVTLAEAISGKGPVTKTGLGTLTLLGVNSYQGGITVSAGRLAGNTLSLLGNIANNAELEFNQAGDGDYFSTISGSGSLFKSGGGALNMMMNTITQDEVTVSGGSLNVVFGGSMTTIGDVRVNAGYLDLAFGGDMTVGNDLHIGSGGMDVLIDSQLEVTRDLLLDSGELNIEYISGLTVGGDVSVDSGYLGIDFGSLLAVVGDMSVGSGVVDMGFDSNFLVGGDVSVASGALGVDFGSLLAVGGDVGIGAGAMLGVHVDDTAAVNAKTVTAQPGAILNVEGYSEDGRYTVVHSTDGIAGNFMLYVAGAPPATDLDRFLVADLFNDGYDLSIDQNLVWRQSSGAHGHFNIAAGDFTIAAVLADNTMPGAGDNFSWDGASLTKTGQGTLILKEDNIYSGATTVREGTLKVMGTLGNGNYAGAITNNATLVFEQTADQILSGVVSGQGRMEKLSSGALFFNGPSLTAGSLIIGDTGTAVMHTQASLGDTRLEAKPYTQPGSGATLALTAISSINKGAMGNSFIMQGGTNLLVEPASQAIQINAQTTQLASGSQVGVKGYGYGPIMPPGSHTVLTLGGAVNNASSLPVTTGTIAVGSYHYIYDNLAWSADGRDLIMNVKRDSLLTGDASITGSAHIAAKNPAFSVFGNHARGLFQQWENPAEYATGLLQYAQANGGVVSDAGSLETNLNRLWVTPNYVNVNQSSGGGNVGYLLQTPGFAFGYDRQLNDNAFIGAGVSVSWPDYDGGNTDIDARDITFALYTGIRLPYAMELDAHAGWGYTRYDQNRTVADESYSDKYNGKNFFMGLGLGRSFALGEQSGFTLRPGVSYDYIHARINGFDEGAGTFALKTEDYSLDLHRLKAGVDISWEADNGFKAAGEVYYLGVYGDRQANATAHYISNPSSGGFTMLGNGLDKDNLGMGLRVSMPVTESWEIGASYDVLLGADTISQQGTLNVIFKF